jgi:hypothetical protein
VPVDRDAAAEDFAEWSRGPWGEAHCFVDAGGKVGGGGGRGGGFDVLFVREEGVELLGCFCEAGGGVGEVEEGCW